MAKKQSTLMELILRLSDKGSMAETGKKAKKAATDVKKLGKSAHSADRQLKGAAAASSGASKNFSKMSQGITGGLVPAYATLAASMFALSAVFRGLQQAADFRVLNEGMTSFAATSGVMVKNLAKNLQEATGYQLDFRQAAQNSQIMLAAGFSEEQMGRIAKAARGASTALGRDFEDSFNRIVRGATKAEPELLDELGIILRLETATKKYGLAVGKNARELTTFEKSQAVLNEVLSQAETKYGSVAEAVDVNQFNQLIATFVDLKDKAMAFLSPVAEGIAGFFTENIKSAVAALALFVSTLLQSVFPAFDELNAKINNSMIGKMSAGIGGTFKSMGSDIGTAVRAFRGEGEGRARNLAKTFDSSAAQKSSGMKSLRNQEQLNRQQVQGIKKALKLAEAEYRRHGKITTGIFAGENIKKVRDFKSAFLQMQGESNKFFIAFKTGSKITFSVFKASFKATVLSFKVGMKIMAGAAKAGMGAVNLAFRAVAIFGIVQLAMDAFNALKANMDKVLLFFAKAVSFVSSLMKRFADMIRGFAPKIAGAIDAGAGALDQKVLEIEKSASGEGDGFFAKMADDAIKNRPGSILADQFEDAKERISEVNTEFKDMMKERQKLLDKGGKGQTASQIAAANIATVASSGIGSLARMYGQSQGPDSEFTEEQKTGIAKEFMLLGQNLGSINPQIKELFSSYADGKITQAEFIEGLEGAGVKAQAQNTAFKNLNSTIEGFQSQAAKMSKRNPIDDMLGSLKNLDETIRLTEGGANKKDIVTEIYEGIFGAAGDMKLEDMEKALEGFATSLKSVVDTRRQMALANADLSVRSAGLQFRKGAAARFAKEDIKKEQLANAVTLAQAAVTELDAVQNKTDEDEYQLELAKKQVLITQAQQKAYEESTGIAMKLQNTFEQGIEKMFTDIATGAASAKDAFKSLAVLILQEMAKIAAARMAASVTGFLGFAKGGIMPVQGLADGGYASSGRMRFGTGGIATRPTYMVGEGKHNEAVVPLPDGRTIPVSMEGGGAGTNNVTINVDASGGSTNAGNGEQAKALGVAIQAAVMETIQRERRPGGILT